MKWFKGLSGAHKLFTSCDGFAAEAVGGSRRAYSRCLAPGSRWVWRKALARMSARQETAAVGHVHETVLAATVTASLLLERPDKHERRFLGFAAVKQ